MVFSLNLIVALLSLPFTLFLEHILVVLKMILAKVSTRYVIAKHDSNATRACSWSSFIISSLARLP